MSKLTPLKAIKQHCKWCQQTDRMQIVRECQDKQCPLHPLRMGKAVKGVPALKTIRRKCRECVETSEDIKACDGEMSNGVCPLHAFRFGKRPSTLQKKDAGAASFEAETASS